MTRIVLASASPRRKALLEDLGLQPEIICSGVDEIDNGDPSAIVTANARAKRDDGARRVDGDALVIAADTLVFLDDRVFGKPADLDEARAMLRELVGKTHQVLTGVAVLDTASGQAVDACERTDVTFRALSDDEIDVFVDAVKPLDRAGAYTVEGPGSLLVERYNGCYHNVLGLPLVALDTLCRHLGHSLFKLVNPDRANFR